MFITSNFDSGNIIVNSLDDPKNIQLEIKKDTQSDFYQWFYFKLTGAADVSCKLNITNAGGAAYAKGWNGYKACASYDREIWFRVDTSFDGQTLSIDHTPEADGIYYAYFTPYTMERHANLICEAITSPLVKHTMLGHTLDGQDIDLLEVSDGKDTDKKLKCWFIARQHPGESMAEWWAEGFLEKLLDESDPISRKLLQSCVFYIVPNMNPDGTKRGHLRTNAVGSNLNREWNASSMKKSPEVHLVLQAMREKGIDFHMDVHGDEDLPYNFLVGFEGIPNLSTIQLQLFQSYQQALLKQSPDFQTENGYPVDPPGKGNLQICNNYIAETFRCPAMTLEMPFKDNANLPDIDFGWSADRSMHLGRSCLSALWDVLPALQASK
jgi:murein tripeptide amidase MpaA